MSAYSDLILGTAGLAQYWRLGDASGTTASNAKGGGEAGTYVATPTLGAAGNLAANDADKAMTTNGTSSYMKVDAHTAVAAPGSAAFAMEAWVRTTSVATNVWLFGEGSSSSNNPVAYVGISSTTAGKPRVLARNNAGGGGVDVSGSTSINDGIAHHIVWSSNGTGTVLYVDNVAQFFTGVVTGTVAYNQFAAGALYRTTAASFMAATIDEIALYTTGLSTAQVANHYEVGRYASGLLL